MFIIILRKESVKCYNELPYPYQRFKTGLLLDYNKEKSLGYFYPRDYKFSI